MTHDADVLIVGAGPAGLALACALADAGITPCVLEQSPAAAVQQPAEDGRDIALTHRARAVLTQLGLWQRLPEDLPSPLRAARVVDGDDRRASLHFDSQGTGLASLGWLVPNHAIRRAAWEGARDRPAVRIAFDATVCGLSSDEHGAQLRLTDGRRLQAPLVVAADSRFSTTRRLGGIGASHHDFARSVIVGRVAHTEDAQGIAWECFRYGQTLALLPMNGRQCSAVVTVDARQAPTWLALSDADFAARVQAMSPAALGPLAAAGTRHAYPLVGVYAHRFSAHRLALVGDAAVGMHPVTAHGYNFGLYGIEVLARELAHSRRAGIDLGEQQALARFAREHRQTTWPTYVGTNALVQLFTRETPAARLVRKAVLNLSDRLPGLSHLVKARVTEQLTGRRPGTIDPNEAARTATETPVQAAAVR